MRLDPALVDPSALRDRIEDDDEEFALFRDGIRESGQHQPILSVRMIRSRDATSSYSAIVAHALQENSVGRCWPSSRAWMRSRTSLRKARRIRGGRTIPSSKRLFSRKAASRTGPFQGRREGLAKRRRHACCRGCSRSPRSFRRTSSKAIGAARTIGRDRWEDLKKLFNGPKQVDRAREIVASEAFWRSDSAGRFSLLWTKLKAGGAGQRKRAACLRFSLGWPGQARRRELANHERTFSLSLSETDAPSFRRIPLVPPGRPIRGLQASESRAPQQEINPQRKRPPKRHRPGSPSRRFATRRISLPRITVKRLVRDGAVSASRFSLPERKAKAWNRINPRRPSGGGR